MKYALISLFSLSLFAAEPAGYQSMSACQKQETLWQEILNSSHQTLPELGELGLGEVYGMWKQGTEMKKMHASDYAPERWEKYLHKRASMAKIKLEPVEGNDYTGVFAGAECALIRLSVTYDPASKGHKVAPGLALKFLRSGMSSANVSMLYSIDGQGNDYDILANPLSNIVPAGSGIGSWIVHWLFSKVSEKPEELMASDMASYEEDGSSMKDKKKSPRHVFLVPAGATSFSSEPHDFRDDLETIEAGTVLYEVKVLEDESMKNADYSDYRIEDIEGLVKKSKHIGNIVTTSEFIASEFGDTGIFFQHEIK